MLKSSYSHKVLLNIFSCLNTHLWIQSSVRLLLLHRRRFYCHFLSCFHFCDCSHHLGNLAEEGSQPGVVAHACNSSYLGGGSRRIVVWGSPKQVSGKPYLKNKLNSKDGAGHGSSGTPQVQSPFWVGRLDGWMDTGVQCWDLYLGN
jgi:hypothetical protein